MVIKRGDVWWASLGNPKGSGPGYRRPVVIIQSNPFNESKINTVVIAAITSNLELEKAPGNLNLRKSKKIGLTKNSVLNVSQIYTIDKSFLSEKIGKLSSAQIREMGDGLKLVLDL